MHFISFAKNEPEFDPIWVNRQTLETVNSVKLLGLNISSDFKWNGHVSELVRKVSTRLYFLRQLKTSHVATRELLFYTGILQYTHSLYSGVRQPSFSSRSTKLSKRRPRKTSKTRYEDYLPRAILC